MKKFLLQITFFSLFTIFILAFFLWLTNDSSAYFSSIIDKHIGVTKVKEKKIIIIGGSNNAFGINSKEISDSLGLRVYNMSVSYFFGLDFMLKDIKDYVKQGDVILIIPEYELFYGDAINGNIGLYSMLLSNPRGFSKLNYQQWLNSPKKFFTIASEKIKGIGRKNKFNNAIYNRNSFNEWGDLIAHLNEKKTQIKFDKMHTEGNFNFETINVIKTFISQANLKHATVLITFPSLAKTSANDTIIGPVYTILNKNFQSNIIFRPSDFIFEDSLFYDDFYHLNSNGRNIRTKKLIKGLSDKIKPVLNQSYDLY